LFDIRADRELMTYHEENIREGVTNISFSNSGRFLFASYDDKKVICWDTLKGKQLINMTNHENRVSCVSVSPDGYAVATG
jgi:guanine nucleotide-binding protein G(I)/G(S)/G(T) subunit beta-1